MGEAALRVAIFITLFAVLAGAEVLWQRRSLRQGRWGRWRINLGLTLLNAVVVRLSVGALAVSAAVVAQARGWGLLHQMGMPPWVDYPVAFLGLDAAVYLQHVLTHKIPVLWRLHRVHHADLDLDVTSGLRFHPLEMLLSMGFKAVVVLVLGAPAAAVIAFEVALNAASLFTHANLRLPAWLDRGLRWGICTPDMHRVHHSVDPRETDRNFGFFLSLWDRLFATYHAAPPAGGHDGAALGLAPWRDQRRLGMGALLLMPFRPPPPAA